MTAPDVAAAVHAGFTTTTSQLEDALADASTNVSASCCATAVYTDKFDSRLAWYEDIIVGFFLILVGVVSVLGNGSSLVMFWRRRRHLTTAEVLLVNMALMHLFLALASYPAPMVSSFHHRWLFGDLGCQLYGFICYVLGIATIFSMTALAVVRYLKTCTYTYSRSLTMQHMKVVLAAVYLYSAFWGFLPLFEIISNYEVEPFGTSCTLDWSNPNNSARVYILVVVMLVVALPSLVMFWCYTRILLLVHRNQRKKLVIIKRSSASQGPSELQITLVSGLVCMGFIVAWLPYTVVSVMYGLLGRATPIYVSLAPVLLAKSSCAYNPIIYIFINARYRREMVGILQERLGPLLCCPVREDNRPHQHDNQPVSTSIMTRVARETGATDEDLPLEVLTETYHMRDPPTVSASPALTTDGNVAERQSAETAVTDQAAECLLPDQATQDDPPAGRLKSFSCENIHPLYQFPDQRGHLGRSFSSSHGHHSDKSFRRFRRNREEESLLSSTGVQDIKVDMVSLPLAMRVTTMGPSDEFVTDISPCTKLFKSPLTVAFSETFEADTVPLAEPGASNISSEEFQRHEELQGNTTALAGMVTSSAVPSSCDLSRTSTSEEMPKGTANASTENLVATVVVATDNLAGTIQETGQRGVTITPLTDHTNHIASTVSSPTETPIQQSRQQTGPPSAPQSPVTPEALSLAEPPAAGSLPRPRRPTVLRL